MATVEEQQRRVLKSKKKKDKRRAKAAERADKQAEENANDGRTSAVQRWQSRAWIAGSTAT